MIKVRVTAKTEGHPDRVGVFEVKKLSNKLVGPGVNGKVIYDLKKRGKSEVTMTNGEVVIFEVIKEEGEQANV